MALQLWEPDPDDDLSDVVKRFAAVRKSTRQKLANDDRTRQVLAAALRLIDKQFSAALVPDDEGRRYPFFQWLSRPQIAAEAVAVLPNLDDAERERLAEKIEGLMERRWIPHERFIEDLLHYALHTRHWSLHLALSADAADLLFDGLQNGSFVASVHQVAYEDLMLSVKMSATWRLNLLAAALTEREPELRDVLAETYRVVDESWTQLYKSLFEKRGWTLRRGISFQNLNLMLSTAAEGMALRALVDKTGIIDSNAETSLLGTLAFTIIASCIDIGDGKSLEELVESFASPMD